MLTHFSTFYINIHLFYHVYDLQNFFLYTEENFTITNQFYHLKLYLTLLFLFI